MSQLSSQDDFERYHRKLIEDCAALGDPKAIRIKHERDNPPMRRLQTMSRLLDSPLHYVEDDELQVEDRLKVQYRGAPLKVKVVEVREGNEAQALGSEVVGHRPIRMCIVAQLRDQT